MDNLINTFKCLSDETRLRIVMLLNNKELCVCELCHIMDVSQPKVSKHLSKLKALGIVKTHRDAQWIFYHLDIHNPAFLQLLNSIQENLSSYPILLKDHLAFTNRKEDYKDLCSK